LRIPKVLCVTAVALFAATLAHGQTATVHVAAAADLQPVLPAVMKAYRDKTGTNVEVSYASSATLATQILNGAPIDLFLSADLGFAQKLTDASLSDAPVPYAEGTLVLWARKDSPIQPLGLASLRSPLLKRLAVANPEHAPYGRAARAAIEKMGLTAQLQPKLVVGENIAQTAQYAESGNAEAGFISLTSAVTQKFRSEGSYVLVPPEDYPPLTQGAAVLKHSPGAAGGQRLLEYLLSAPAQAMLAERGLKPVR
jgi:molybdate transport system substrate-binding protein